MQFDPPPLAYRPVPARVDNDHPDTNMQHEGSARRGQPGLIIEVPTFVDEDTDEGPILEEPNLDDLQDCAYKQSVKDFAKSVSGPVSFRHCAGPALKYAALAILLLLATNTYLVLVAYFTSKCDAVSQTVTMQRFISWTILPSALARLWLEWRCHKYITIPYYQVVGYFGPAWIANCFGKSSFMVKYQFWILWMFANSVLQIIDHTNDSLFTAWAVAAEECSGHLVDFYFSFARQKAIFWIQRDVPLFCDFKFQVTLLWFTIFLQQLVPLIHSAPSCSEIGTVTLDVGSGSHDYKNMFGEVQNHGDTLCVLGEAAGFGTLLQIGLFYPKEKQKKSWLQSRTPAATNDDVKKGLEYLYNGAKRVLSRVALVGLLENCLQANMQVYVFAVTRSILKPLKGEADSAKNFSICFSICTSLVMCIMKLNEAKFAVEWAWEVRENTHRAMHQAEQEATPAASEEEIVSSRLHSEQSPRIRRSVFLREEELRLYRKCRRTVLCIILFAVVVLVSTLYACLRLIFVFVCPDGMWNAYGCIDMTEFKEHLRHSS